MASHWFPMRDDLDNDPAVVGIAKQLGQDDLFVIGRLWKLWSIAQQQSDNGLLPHFTPEAIDEKCRCPGFAAACDKVKWLTILPDGVLIPNFDHWLSESAKKRYRQTLKKRRQRGDNCPPSVPQNGDNCPPSVPQNGDNCPPSVPLTEQNRTEQSASAKKQQQQSRAPSCPGTAAADFDPKEALRNAGLDKSAASKYAGQKSADLIREAIALLGERIASANGTPIKNPAGFLRKVLDDPEGYGLQETASGWKRPGRNKAPADPKAEAAAAVTEAFEKDKVRLKPFLQRYRKLPVRERERLEQEALQSQPLLEGQLTKLSLVCAMRLADQEAGRAEA